LSGLGKCTTVLPAAASRLAGCRIAILAMTRQRELQSLGCKSIGSIHVGDIRAILLFIRSGRLA